MPEAVLQKLQQAASILLGALPLHPPPSSRALQMLQGCLRTGLVQPSEELDLELGLSWKLPEKLLEKLPEQLPWLVGGPRGVVPSWACLSSPTAACNQNNQSELLQKGLLYLNSCNIPGRAACTAEHRWLWIPWHCPGPEAAG